MLATNEYIGLDLREEAIKVAHVKVEKSKIKLLRLDQFSLVEKIKTGGGPGRRDSDQDDIFDEEQDSDDIFGLDEEEGPPEDLDLDADDEEIDFEELAGEEVPEEEDPMSLDMVDESGTTRSNEMVLYNILSGIDAQRVHVGVNIPAGNTIFQIIRDTNFKEVKKKDLIRDLEEKLQSIYGVTKSSDYYSYVVREDGSLLLASVDDESPMLGLINKTRDMYGGKITVEEVLPDEAALVGLVNANYDLQHDEITGVLQFGKSQCRIIFLKGNEIWQVSPIINEGTKNKSFLNTVFSKILFQLDTGEVPNLDRIILANNTLGEEAVVFFQKNFSDLTVSNFRFNEEKFDFENINPETAHSFTTAIAQAWAASGQDNEYFSGLSLMPSYILERQKIFKLRWHGVFLLLLIFLSPLTFNYFYQQNISHINSLSTDLERLNNQIAEVDPIVENTNQVSEQLGLLREQLVMLDTLSNGSREWSRKFQIVNEGVSNIGNTWLTSMSQSEQGALIEGYTLFRNRVPRVVNIFNRATLLDVTIQEVREQEVFEFSILVSEFDSDPEAYSPPTPDDLQEILNN